MTLCRKHIFLLLVLLILVGCEKQEITIENIICLTESEDNIYEANGINKITFHALVPRNARDETVIDFEISEGVFLDSQKNRTSLKASHILINEPCSNNPQGYRVASASFLAPARAGTNIRIVATVAGKYSADRDFSFTTALPDTLWVIANKFQIDTTPNSEVLLQGFMRSGRGIPSLETQVNVQITEVTTGNQVTQPRFRDYHMLSDTAGKVSVIFSSLNLSYHGDLLIEFFVEKDPQIRASVLVRVD